MITFCGIVEQACDVVCDEFNGCLLALGYK